MGKESEVSKAALAETAKVPASGLENRWRTMDSAPDLDRVIVAGWQKASGRVVGYWWMHEDVIADGKPLAPNGLMRALSEPQS